MPAVTFPSLPCSEAALPSLSPFLVVGVVVVVLVVVNHFTWHSHERLLVAIYFCLILNIGRYIFCMILHVARDQCK